MGSRNDPRDREKLAMRLSIIGLPNYSITPYLELVYKWKDCSGLEWTVSRLKSMKIDLIRQRAGLDKLGWYAKNRKGQIKGVIGSIFRWATLSERNFHRAIQVFNLYTFWVYSEITESQWSKFITGVNSKTPTDVEFLAKELGDFSSSLVVAKPSRLRKPKPFIVEEGSPSRRAPVWYSRKTVPQDSRMLDDLIVFNSRWGPSLYGKYHRIFRPLLKGTERRDILDEIERNHYPSGEMDFSEMPIGKIGYIQEPGGKLRSVANPYRIYQAALRPLGEYLYGLLRNLPWDCTHDQSAAFQPIQTHLLRGKTVYSIDLSSATDYFPLDLQIEVLKSVVPEKSHDYIDLWSTLCRGSWYSTKGEVRWTNGQPLGMYPSFAAFGLTHGALLMYLLKRMRPYRGNTWNNEFFVVGDDVVITDNKLHIAYVETLERIGCPHSPDKSITSDYLAEFAGKIITSISIVPQYKWREMSDDNFLDLCRILGPRSRELLRPRQKRVFDAVKHLLPPYGLNFSMPDDNLAKMLDRTYSSVFFNEEERSLPSLMGLRRRLNRNVYDSNPAERLTIDVVNDMTATFDEKVEDILKLSVFRDWKRINHMVYGLSSIPEVVEPNGSSLPLESKPVGVKSLLERLECIMEKHS